MLPEIDKAALHKAICTELNDTYRKKNADYGDSFAQLRKRYPNFICVRVFDKLNRADTLISGSKQQVDNETIEDTLLDIANYCIMEVLERRLEKGDQTRNLCF